MEYPNTIRITVCNDCETYIIQNQQHEFCKIALDWKLDKFIRMLCVGKSKMYY